MHANTNSLASVYKGWDGYQFSLAQALAPLTAENLRFQPVVQLRSVGEIFRHIALGRLNWFLRMDAPGSRELAERIGDYWEVDPDGNRHIIEDAISITDQPNELMTWLRDSWQMIEQTLNAWTIEDLTKTYRHTYGGKTYDVSRQWTIWRIMSHDIHHGGQLVVLLEMQGIECFELGTMGGHMVELPLADNAERASKPGHGR